MAVSSHATTASPSTNTNQPPLPRRFMLTHCSHLSSEGNLPLLHSEPGGLVRLILVEVQVLVICDPTVVLEWQNLDTWLASHQARSWLIINGTLAIARSRSHTDDRGISPAEAASATGDHDVVLALVDDVLLVLEAAPVAKWVEAARVDDFVQGEHTKLGVVLSVAWVG